MSVLGTMVAYLLAADPVVLLDLPDDANPSEYVQATWVEGGLQGGVTANVIQPPAWQMHWRGDTTELLEQPRSLLHVTGPRETLDDLAVRYGTTTARLLDSNRKLVSDRREFLPVGVEVEVEAIRIPPPRHPVQYTVKSGESWETIAVDHRVDPLDLMAYNDSEGDDRLLELAPDRVITVWVDPGLPWTVGRQPGPAPVPAWFDIPQGALSQGHPNRGRISGEPVMLPEIPELYTRRFERIAHGSSHALEVIVTAFAQFRHATGYEGEILVGSISRPNGRRFAPHRSHQSGRDVDIRLPIYPWTTATLEPPIEQIDWHATWGLIHAFMATGQVEMIFLDDDLQRPLYYAARSMGATAEELEAIITWARPTGDHARKVIRHEKGHEGHIHVRIRCGEDEPRCRTHR